MDARPTEVNTLSLHDALPIFGGRPTVLEIELGARRATCRVHDGPRPGAARMRAAHAVALRLLGLTADVRARSEEHTSELQSRPHLVCRLLLEKKKDGRYCCSV